MNTNAKQILVLPSADERTNRRCAAYARFLARLACVEGKDTLLPTSAAIDAEQFLRMLRTRGAILLQPASGDAWDVKYLPTYEVSRRVLQETQKEGVWPKKIRSEHAAAFRSSEGAIFRFPLELGEEAIEVFITDWSPCPAACAVAVHRAHPHAEAPGKGASSNNFFAGKYVRHPLTGDLLPVWVASFVRADFGTGAVLINPAHDRADLAFGRQVGLPIKFALVDESHDGTPATWPVPPVIKSGKAVRAGICDGAGVTEAREKYLDLLVSYGLAATHRDLNPGTWTIGELVPSAGGNIGVSSANWSLSFLEAGATATQRFAFVPNETLLASIAPQPATPMTIVCAAGSADSLLAFRLLAAERAAPEPSSVDVVQAVQGKELADVASDHLDLAMVLMVKISETAAIKPQDLEQVSRFLANHAELLSAAAVPGTHQEGDQSIVVAARKVKQTLQKDGLARGFSELYRLQKLLKDKVANGAVPPSGYAAYLALAEVMTGVRTTPGLNLGEIWSQV